MGLDSWRSVLPLSSPCLAADSATAVARVWLAHSEHQILEVCCRDWHSWRNPRQNICCRARSRSFDSGNSSYGDVRSSQIEIPGSIQILKQKNRQKNPVLRSCEIEIDTLVSSSIKRAFSSMVYMLKSMHRVTLEMLCCDEENSMINDLWGLFQREMHASFLWLFQQVFASTPKLMLSIMILLANFSVYSMDYSIAIQSPVPEATFLDRPSASTFLVSRTSLDFKEEEDYVVTSEASGAGSNDGGKNSKVLVAGGTDGEESPPLPRATSKRTTIEAPLLRRATSKRTTIEASTSTSTSASSTSEHQHQQAVMKFLQQVPVPDAISKKFLVAPVTATLEPDNYACYDRTDLVYQQALRMDGKNPLILANYAQFLYVVRHDHDRAEELFRLAMEADPSDGESLSRFANFLWVARGDKHRAENAYKNAIAAEPENPFHVGSYAHFLWHNET